MKLIIDKRNLEQLQKLKESIENLLEISSEDIEFTEENFKKIKEMVDNINILGASGFKFGKLYIKIVSSDGTKFTNI